MNSLIYPITISIHHMGSPTLSSDRRSFLKRTTLGLVASGTVLTSGCTESLPPLGQQVRYGSVNTPAPGPGSNSSAYRRWMPAASALPSGVHPGYVNHATPGNLGDDVVGASNRNPHFFQKLHLDYFGIGYDNYDRVLGLHSLTSTFVLEGTINTTSVIDTLTDSGYIEAGSYAGYNLLQRSDEPRTAAVHEDAIVWAHHDEARAIVEAVIDAERGAVERHHESEESFAIASEEIGARPWTWIGAPTFEPTGKALVSAMSFTFDENAIFYIFQHLYEAGDTVSEQALRNELEDHSRAQDAWAVDVEIDERITSVVMQQTHESAREEFDTTNQIPQITWGITDKDGSITVTHEAGDPVTAENITLYVASSDERTPTGAQFADEYEEIETGDAITIDAPDDPGAERIVGAFSVADSSSTSYFVVYELP